ncbi:GlxA family transcriptional regulator [Pokkaliibacter sp. CJK22405]|uniref:GlxA family transcriptional regulator n=1 Tax=Pokkaliibacter sp. CJK22405 TaxID=3384615 RepID=UPI003984ADF3
MANWISGKTLYEYISLSTDGAGVAASVGATMQVDHALDDFPEVDLLLVIGASPIAKTGHETELSWLRNHGRRLLAIGGVGTGSYLLARAGLLDGCKATIHWWDLNHLRESFPNTYLTTNLFEVDNGRFTCSGGSASMDMILHIIGHQFGLDLAASISEQFVCERIRTHEEPQRVPLKSRIGVSQPKLIEAVTLMEANIEEPLSPDDLAMHVGVSRRHLERLFKKYLVTVPSKYYLELRLERARQMLQQSNKSIVQVGLACGFSSASHFSTTYRNHFQITPREERNNRTRPGGLGFSVEL